MESILKEVARDKVIEISLHYLYENRKSKGVNLFKYLQEAEVDVEDIPLYIARMEVYGLLKRIDKYCMIETRGSEIQEMGGWISHVESERNREYVREARASTQHELNKVQLKSYEFVNKHTKINTWISCIGVAVTLFNLVIIIFQLFA
jgi:hypothetical protein